MKNSFWTFVQFSSKEKKNDSYRKLDKNASSWSKHKKKNGDIYLYRNRNIYWYTYTYTYR